MIERTLSIIKPDAIKRNLSGEINAKIESEGFVILAQKMLKVNDIQAMAFYAEHKERKFYQDLVKFMTSGSLIVQVLERIDAIKKYREIMGATNPAEAAEHTIRKKFGENIERNCVHGSDSDKSAAYEIAFFFSTIDLI